MFIFIYRYINLRARRKTDCDWDLEVVPRGLVSIFIA